MHWFCLSFSAQYDFKKQVPLYVHAFDCFSFIGILIVIDATCQSKNVCINQQQMSIMCQDIIMIIIAFYDDKLRVDSFSELLMSSCKY